MVRHCKSVSIKSISYFDFDSAHNGTLVDLMAVRQHCAVATLIRTQFIRLVKAMLPDGIEPTPENYSKAMLGAIATKPVARKSGSLRAGSTVTHKRFWVASFLHQENWQDLKEVKSGKSK
jgi:hypothetical protein